ncbi:MAG: nuclear transport factor 2 family protein [Planctomycetota bacterium]
MLTTFLPPAYAKLEDPPFAPVQTGEQCTAEVDRQAALGADLIKIWYIVRRPADAEGNRPLLDATVLAAKRHGLLVAVHATQLAAARQAVATGARVLVHSVEDAAVDEEFVDALVRQGTTYVPTLMVIEGYAEVLGQKLDLLPIEWQMGQPEVIGTWFDLDRLARVDAGLARRSQGWRSRLQGRQVLFDNLRAVQRGGGAIAAGTDAGNIGTLHGPSLFRELDLMVEAGMAPFDVLVAATRGGARLLGKENEFGDVKVGMRADLLVLTADPRQDLVTLQRPEHVVLRGRLLPIAEIRRETPAQVVQRQLNAYNARDIERFAACYADDVVVGNLGPDGPAESMRGKDKLRERWAERFSSAPDLHCRIENRIENRDTVIDHEFVTGVPDRGDVHAVAVYRVKDGLIQSVWFVR